MSKLGALLVGGVGYVLGTRAGRDRYEQIKGLATKVKDNPTVQQNTRRGAHAARGAARDAAPVVRDKVVGAASAAAESVKSSGSSQGTVPMEENSYPAAGTETPSQNGPGGH